MIRNTHRCTVIEVTGRYNFPVDMLRYDLCCPVGPDDVSNIEAKIGHPMPNRDTVTIRLNCFARCPTPGRWASFGWTMKEIEGGRDE